MDKRILAMQEIMNMRYVPFINALLNNTLPDFEREKKEDYVEDEDSLPLLIPMQVHDIKTEDPRSPIMASLHRHDLRYMSVKEFLQEYPCTIPITDGDYDLENKFNTRK